MDAKDLVPFVTDFACGSAINSIIKGKIQNVDDLWNRNQYTLASDECLEIVYRSIPTIEDSHPSIDRIWRVKDVFVICIADDGEFNIRIPLHLHPYDFEFGFRAKDTTSEQWGPRSPTQRVTVPSFSEPHDYEVGETVNFRNPTNCRVSEGSILKKLDDDRYQIQYNMISGDEINSVELEVHCSKISRKGIEECTTIQIGDDEEMIRNLLIRRHDKESITIFDTIRGELEMETQIYCFDHYDKTEMMDHWESMALFVTVHVFRYLFPPRFEYKVDCLGDGQHGMLTLNNLRVKDMRNDYEMLKSAKLRGEKGVEIGVNSFDSEYIRYGCDCCRDLMTEWDYVYSCHALDWDERHDFCMLCVHTVVKLNQQMARLLGMVLKDTLDGDCIQSIVDFVIGRVLYIQNTDHKPESGNKHELSGTVLPDAKRRRMNPS